MSINYDVELDKLITGTITALNGTVDLTSNNKGTTVVTVTGTWSATLLIEGSADGTTYVTITSLNNATKLFISSFTANGTYLVPSNGYAFLRIRASAFTSGTVTVNSTASDGTTIDISDSTLRGATDGTQIGNNGNRLLTDVVGNIPSASTDSGNPVKTGGVFNTTLPTATNGQRVDSQSTPKGSKHVNLRNGSDGTEMIGQKTMANSVPVVLPSDQVLTTTASPLPASGSGFSFGSVATSALTQVPVRSTTYTQVTTNSTMTIASSSANDTAAGTGARSVSVTYLDQNMTGPFTVTVNLNGTTQVPITGSMCYIEKVVVATVGSGLSNAGILTIRTGGGATVGTIAAGANRTLWTHHYVPQGKICYISGFSFGNTGSAQGNGAQFILRTSTPTVANTPEIQISDFVTVAGISNTDTRVYNSPIQVAGPARILAYVTPYATAATTQFASIDYIDN